MFLHTKYHNFLSGSVEWDGVYLSPFLLRDPDLSASGQLLLKIGARMNIIKHQNIKIDDTDVDGNHEKSQ